MAGRGLRAMTTGLGKCNKRCLNAKKPRCKCECRGLNHGWAVKRQTDENAELILNHIPEVFSIFEGQPCLSCGFNLSYATVKGYPHQNGLYVDRYKVNLWVYAECFTCGYQNPFTKFVTTSFREAMMP